MKTNIDNPSLPSKFTEITTASTVVGAGAAGWIDTDVSAITGTITNQSWQIIVIIAAQDVGARVHGSALDPIITAIGEAGLFSRVDNSGHMDLYRGANPVTYRFLGYFG